MATSSIVKVSITVNGILNSPSETVQITRKAVADSLGMKRSTVVVEEPKARSTFTWKDIQKDKRPSWSKQKCIDWLWDNRRQIEDDMTSAGWASIDTLLDM